MKRFILNIVNSITSLFKKKEEPIFVLDESILLDVHKYRGLLWEKISQFQEQLGGLDTAVSHTVGEEQSEGMVDAFPLKHDLNNGLYTREVFMPKGSVVVSFIHKQDHPSFVLEGDASVLLDDGSIVRYKQGDKIMTKTGTQRVLFMHEDTRWVCVYRTDAKTVSEAEKDVYANDFTELTETIISNNRLLWQE